MFSQQPSQTDLHLELRPSFPMSLVDQDLSSTDSFSTEVRNSTRAVWVDQCLRRLRELRPDEDPLFLTNMVGEIWHDVSNFHPVVAAELEHECWD